MLKKTGALDGVNDSSGSPSPPPVGRAGHFLSFPQLAFFSHWHLFFPSLPVGRHLFPSRVYPFFLFLLRPKNFYSVLTLPIPLFPPLPPRPQSVIISIHESKQMPEEEPLHAAPQIPSIFLVTPPRH